MTPSNSEPRRRIRRHLLRALAASAVAVGMIGVLAAPAQAEQKCTGGGESNFCFTIDKLADGSYQVHFAIDYYMTRQEAQTIIDPPGDPIRAEIWASDPSYLGGPNVRYSPVPMTLLVASDGGYGLGAEFNVVVNRDVLNEDQPWLGDDEDDIFGKLIVLPTNKVFDSKMFNQRF